MAKTKRRPAPWARAPKALVGRVEAYQLARGLKVDGIPGVQTVSQFFSDLDALRPQPPDVEPPTQKPPAGRVNWGLIVTIAAVSLIAAGMFWLPGL